jgi:hypothetical protein
VGIEKGKAEVDINAASSCRKPAEDYSGIKSSWPGSFLTHRINLSPSASDSSILDGVNDLSD